jgi:CRP/FNR family transcriptional regulator, polysaccharide utilization system transcription regulator
VIELNLITQNNVMLPIFAKLPFQDTLSFSKKYILFRSGQKINNLYLLTEGYVKESRMTAKGNPILYTFYQPGDLIGLKEFLSGKIYLTEGICSDNIKAKPIPANEMEKHLFGDTTLSRKICELFIQKSELIQAQLFYLVTKNLRGRLAFILIHILKNYGMDANGALILKITRTDLASYANMNTANVIRTLSAFSHEKLIRTEGRNIWITNESQLKRVLETQ